MTTYIYAVPTSIMRIYPAKWGFLTALYLTTCLSLVPYVAAHTEDGAEIQMEELLQLSLEELLQINVITASKREESSLTSPSPVRVLSYQDIENLGFATLEETLNYVLGVSSINGEGNVFTTYTVRGNTLINFNTDTLLMLDGVPVYSPYHGSFDLAAIPMSMVERVEVIPGAQSVLYGTNAINAVINIISRKPETTSNKARIRVGSYSNYLINWQHTQVLEKGSLDFFLDANGRDGETFAIEDELGNSANYKDKLDIASAAIVWRSDELQTRLVQYNRSLNNFRTRSFDTRQENDEAGWLASIQYKKESNLGLWRFQLSYHDWQLEKEFIPYDANGDIPNATRYNWDYTGELLDTQMELDTKFSDHHSAVAGINLNRGNARRYKEDVGDYDIGKSDQATYSGALFWNGIVEANDHHTLHYGVRYTHSSFDDAITHNKVEFNDTSSRLGWVYQLNKQNSFKVLYGEAFRVPTYFEKQVSSSSVLGNPDLEPETSKSFDLVWVQLSKRWQWEVNPFIMEIDNKITRVDLQVPVTDPDFGKRQNQNIGNVQFTGIETSARYLLHSTLRTSFGLGLYKGKNLDSNQDLPFTYDYMLHGQVDYTISKNWKSTASMKLLDNWGAAEDYIILNMNAEYRLPWGNEYWLEIRAENLLNETITLPEISREKPEVTTIPERSDRFLFVGLRFEF